jgi:hypothetical protein
MTEGPPGESRPGVGERLTPLGVSLASLVPVGGVLFFALGVDRTGHVRDYSELVVGPILLVLLPIGTAGWISPGWWTPKRTIVASLVAFALLFGRLWNGHG